MVTAYPVLWGRTH